jgi:hypothetical protein
LTPARHQALTVVAPIEPGAERALEERLRESASALRRALAGSATTHFARWVLLPPPGAGDGRVDDARPLLVFESNFDGELDAHVAELCACLGPLMDGAFRGAHGFPGSDDVAALTAFFRASSRRSAALITGYAGLSVPVVRGDAALRAALDARLLDLSRGSHLSELGLARELQRTARAVAHERGLELGVGGGERADSPRRAPARVARPLEVLLVLGLSWLFELGEGLARRRPPSFEAPSDRARRDALAEEEDRVAQNALSHLVAVKPGWFRSFALKVMLPVAEALGLPATHFARWVPLADGRLLFLSSYDGSSEAYLSALISRAAKRLTMVWSHTRWFPKTRLSSFGGVRRAGAFKAWLRAHQVPTQVWYSAYPHLSVAEVRKNAKIRALLGRELSESSATELLALL